MQRNIEMASHACRVMVTMRFDGDFDTVVNDEGQVIR
jgi:hypothetical protein